jgi:hypothetical protein
MDHSALDQAMSLLGNLMVARKRSPIHLVVCGGSALIALNLVTRTTKDVDVLATLDEGQLNCARPLPEWLREDANAVRTELNLPDNWLNDGPADENLFRLGLPTGVVGRLVQREFGPVLKVSFISRYDQICGGRSGRASFHGFEKTFPNGGRTVGGGALDFHPGRFRRFSSGGRRSPPSSWLWKPH